MSVPCIFELRRMSIMQLFGIWHSCIFLTVAVGLVKILILTSICSWLGGYLYLHRVVTLNKCSAAGMLL